MLQAIDLGCERGDWSLFSKVNFSLDAGEALQVVGANGCGKSSLLHILCGLRAASTGDVMWRNQSVQRQRTDYFTELQFIGHKSGIKPNLTVRENMRLAAVVLGATAYRCHVTASSTANELASLC